MTRGRLTCDTSVLVPAVLSWHEHHALAHEVVDRQVRVVPAHVLVETYSVLTRLPAPHRLGPSVVVEALTGLDLDVVALAPERHLEVLAILAAAGVRGGAAYDGLIAYAARDHGLTLATFDRRAGPAYEATGVMLRRL